MALCLRPRRKCQSLILQKGSSDDKLLANTSGPFARKLQTHPEGIMTPVNGDSTICNNYPRVTINNHSQLIVTWKGNGNPNQLWHPYSLVFKTREENLIVDKPQFALLPKNSSLLNYDQANPNVVFLDPYTIYVWDSKSKKNRNIFGILFDRDFNPLTDPFQINPTNTSIDHAGAYIASSDSNKWVAVWYQGTGTGSDSFDIFGQGYIANTPSSAPFQINKYSESDESQPRIVSLVSDDLFAVIYHSMNAGLYNIYLRTIKFPNTILADEPFQVNIHNIGTHWYPQAGFMPAKKRLYIVWYGGPKDTQYNVYINCLDTSNPFQPKHLNSDNIIVNTNTCTEKSCPYMPNIAILSNHIVVTWMSIITKEAYYNIYAQQFDFGLNKIGHEFMVNNPGLMRTQEFPVATNLEKQLMVILWHGGSQGFDCTQIFRQTFSTTVTTPTMGEQIKNQTAFINEPFHFAIPESAFKNREVDITLSYGAILVNSTILPSWLTFYGDNGSFIGTPKLSDYGEVAIEVTAKLSNYSVSQKNPFCLTVSSKEPCLQNNHFEIENSADFSVTKSQLWAIYQIGEDNQLMIDINNANDHGYFYFWPDESTHITSYTQEELPTVFFRHDGSCLAPEFQIEIRFKGFNIDAGFARITFDANCHPDDHSAKHSNLTFAEKAIIGGVLSGIGSTAVGALFSCTIWKGRKFIKNKNLRNKYPIAKRVNDNLKLNYSNFEVNEGKRFFDIIEDLIHDCEEQNIIIETKQINRFSKCLSNAIKQHVVIENKKLTSLFFNRNISLNELMEKRDLIVGTMLTIYNNSTAIQEDTLPQHVPIKILEMS